MRRENDLLQVRALSCLHGGCMGTSAQPGPTRRSFLKLGGASLALIPLVNLTGCSPSPEDPGPERAPAVDPNAERLPPQQQVPPQPAPPVTPPATPPESTRELVRLDENDPDAQALAYTHDAAEVDPQQHPRFEQGQVCANCSLYQARLGGEVQTGTGQDPADEVPGWGGCTLFPGRLVNAAGWCSAWVPRA
jgi:hypothetical protein